MEEAQRLLAVSVWKLYRCRVRRGGLRLHRSLQLSLLVRAARHRYLSARAAAESPPAPALPGTAASAATPERGNLPRDPSGDPRNAWSPNRASGENPNPNLNLNPNLNPNPNRPSGEHPNPNLNLNPNPNPNPNRPTADPRTDQKWGNPLRDWTGSPPNAATGAPGSERDRGSPPSRQTEAPPSGDSPAPGTAQPRPVPDPANRDRDPPTAAPAASRTPGAPRAGQKRRSSGSPGPGPGPVPSKRARLEAEAPPLPPGPPGRCSGPPAAAFGFLIRAVGAC